MGSAHADSCTSIHSGNLLLFLLRCQVLRGAKLNSLCLVLERPDSPVFLLNGPTPAPSHPARPLVQILPLEEFFHRVQKINRKHPPHCHKYLTKKNLPGLLLPQGPVESHSFRHTLGSITGCCLPFSGTIPSLEEPHIASAAVSWRQYAPVTR